MIYNDHQISESTLIRLDINLISDFALYCKHLVCLGITTLATVFKGRSTLLSYITKSNKSSI